VKTRESCIPHPGDIQDWEERVRAHVADASSRDLDDELCDYHHHNNRTVNTKKISFGRMAEEGCSRKVKNAKKFERRPGDKVVKNGMCSSSLPFFPSPSSVASQSANTHSLIFFVLKSVVEVVEEVEEVKGW
jgi:hypothetical protein